MTENARALKWHWLLPIVLAALGVLGLTAITSQAANTIAWQDASTGLPTSGLVRDAAFGDFDNDGKPDLITAGTNGIVVYKGNGAGAWNGSGYSAGLPVSGQYGHVIVGDFNRDGKLDIAATQNSTGAAGAWVGNGAGSWTAWSGLPTGTYEGLAFADVNRDGWPDLIIAGGAPGYPGVLVFQNNFNSFSQTTAITTTGTYYDVAVDTVDNDGWLDVAAAAQASTGGLRFWRGNFGAWTAANTGLTTTNTFRGVTFGDVDLDGKPELLASRFGFPGPTGGGLFIYKYNIGTNAWSLAANQIPLTGSYYKLLLDDLNNDGRLDLVAGGSSTTGSPGIYAWLNSVAGFSVTASPTTTSGFDRIAIGDFDRNGLSDIAAANNSGSGAAAWRSAGARDPIGAWTPLASPQITGVVRALATGDLNRDGYLDVIMSRDIGAGMAAYLGDGGNGWSPCGVMFNMPGDWEDAVLGQFYRPSLALGVMAASANNGGIQYYQQSSPDCGYWFPGTVTASGSFRGLSVGDIDGNTYSEVVAAPSNLINAGLRLWDGGPNGWSAMPNPVSTGNYYDTALGDFNNDGWLDIAAASDVNGVRVFRSNASLRSWTTFTVTTNGAYQAIAVGDLNNDGQLDIVAGANGGANNGVDVWLGDGAFTTWTAWPSPDTTNQFFDVALGDVNHDGWLDILAGGENIGPKVWLSDGAGGWTPSNTALPTTGSYFRSQFGHIDHDGNLDILATTPGGGLRLWAAAEAAPPTISNIQPSGWISTTQSPTISGSVIDSVSGISATSGLYRYSTNGGSSWSSFFPAAISGSNGSTSTQSITALNVPFGQDSGTQNRLEFRAADMVGNIGTVQAVVQIDVTPPTTPTVLNASHALSTWSNDNTIDINWSGATDATSGVNGYSVSFDQNPTGLPDTTVDTFVTSSTSPALADGNNWYAHVRVRDLAGNWSPNARHSGPFYIDTTPPANPTTVNSTDHTLSTWSNDPTISMSWSGATDGGSGVSGYSYIFDTAAGTLPDTTQDTSGTSATSASLPSGNNKYFHIRTRDNAGNWSAAAVHRGPYWIDVTPPSVSMSSPFNANSNTFLVSWSGSDPHSGVANYDVQYKNVTLNGSWINWKTNTTQTSDNFFGLGGHIYYFRARARDNVGNISTYNSLYDTRTGVATIDLQVKNPGIEVNQAVQDLNNSVTLIANKRTFVRCYVQTSYGTVLLVPARLRVYRGATLMGTLSPANSGALINVKANPDRSWLNDSFYFDVPTGWLNPGSVRFECEVNTPVKYAETTTANNLRSTTVNFVRSPDMNLLIVNARYRSMGSVQNVRDIDRIRLEKWLKAAYPIHKLNVWWGYLDPPYNSLPNVDTLNNDLAWNKSKKILGANEDPWTRYYGMVIDTGGFMRGKAKGIPGTVASGPTGPAGGWDPDAQSYGDWYGGHELGHSYNRKHAEFCGAEGGASYPYPGGRISPSLSEWANNTLYGIDWSLDTPLIITPDWTDVMTYCDNEWMSDFTYEGIYSRMVAEKPVVAAQQPALKPQGVEHLAVFGTIVTQTNAVTLSTFYRVPDAYDVFERDVNGEYHIKLLNAGNAVLADYNFSPRGSVEEDDPVASISEFVPWITGTQQIVIASATQALVTRTVSANPPTITLTSPVNGAILNGVQVSVSWTASDPDNDPLTYNIDYSTDGGATWQPLSGQLLTTTITLDLTELPGSTQGKFRVWASDGVNTAFAETNGTFTVPNKVPKITSISPISGTTYVAGQIISFEASAQDPEDGQLPDGNLQWSSSIDGMLGTGALLQLDTLSASTHTITLTATDSNGAPATATFTIVVGAEADGGGLLFDVFLPLITKN
jgi:hypothetical protein